MAAFQILPVADRRTRRAFLKAPGRVMKGDPNYIAPFVFDAAHRLDPKAHPFFEHGEAGFWVALDASGAPVGRISAQINRSHQALHGARDGHFGSLAGIDDPALFDGLLGTAEGWLRAKGADCAIGPASLSVNEEFGLLVEGFDTPPMLLMGHDPPWAGRFLEAAGYEKAQDLVAYAYDPGAGPPARLAAFAAKFNEIPGARLRTFDKSRFDEDLAAILKVFNDAWSENWGYVPMSEAEISAMAKAFRQIADYGLIFLAEIDGAPVGMAVSLPNVNEALAGLDGAGGPLAIARFVWRLKISGVKSARVLLMGVAKAAQADLAVGAAVSMALVNALVEAHKAKGYRRLELSWILDDNWPMRRIAEAGGAEVYKTYRLYRKDLK